MASFLLPHLELEVFTEAEVHFSSMDRFMYLCNQVRVDSQKKVTIILVEAAMIDHVVCRRKYLYSNIVILMVFRLIDATVTHSGPQCSYSIAPTRDLVYLDRGEDRVQLDRGGRTIGSGTPIPQGGGTSSAHTAGEQGI